MSETYVHGYHQRENERLHDQAGTLVDLLHADTAYPGGSRVLEAGCGVGAQTVTLAQRSPDALITSVDVSADSIAEAQRRVERAGVTNVEFRQADIFTAMIEGVRVSSLAAGLIEPETFDAGVRDLYRTAEADGVFCYTFFKGVGEKPADAPA
jgi:ubiquinone/menaquinone biosynthesis C-methylase UbiE